MTEKKPITPETIRLAKIGLIAVIDEVTGYQEVRPKDELRLKKAELDIAAIVEES